MSFIPQTLGVVLAAIVLWHVLKTEEMVEKMAERPPGCEFCREPGRCGKPPAGSQPRAHGDRPLPPDVDDGPSSHAGEDRKGVTGKMAYVCVSNIKPVQETEMHAMSINSEGEVA